MHWTKIELPNQALPVQSHNVSPRNYLGGKRKSQFTTPVRNRHEAVDELLEPMDRYKAVDELLEPMDRYKAVDELIEPIMTLQFQPR